MPRKTRAEVEGGLYHVITRGNNRRRIFNSADDFQKFLSLLAIQKIKLPFFLYAYCLMSNHVHLLIERKTDAVGRIMHRLLTGYAQYSTNFITGFKNLPASDPGDRLPDSRELSLFSRATPLRRR